MGVDQISKYNDDGSTFGKDSSELISFWGATPLNQPASASQAVYTVTAVTALATAAMITTAAEGFTSGTVATAYVTRVQQMQVDVEGLGVLLNQMRGDLVSAGIIKGSA